MPGRYLDYIGGRAPLPDPSRPPTVGDVLRFLSYVYSSSPTLQGVPLLHHVAQTILDTYPCSDSHKTLVKKMKKAREQANKHSLLTPDSQKKRKKELESKIFIAYSSRPAPPPSAEDVTTASDPDAQATEPVPDPEAPAVPPPSSEDVTTPPDSDSPAAEPAPDPEAPAVPPPSAEDVTTPPDSDAPAAEPAPDPEAPAVPPPSAEDVTTPPDSDAPEDQTATNEPRSCRTRKRKLSLQSDGEESDDSKDSDYNPHPR